MFLQRATITIRSKRQLFLLILLLATLAGCTHQSVDRTGFLPPLKIRIPREARKDPATVAFVRSSEVLINSLSDKMEYIAANGRDILVKNEADLTVLDKIKLVKMNLELVSVSESLIDEMDKIQDYVEKKEKEGVSRSDLKAYEAVEKAIEKRISQLNKKYKKLIE